MNKEYFNNNVMMSIEVEYENGGRFWKTMKGSEADAYCKRVDASDWRYISDIDFCTHQDDEWCKKVLNLADLNWFNNSEWCDRHSLKSFNEVIDFIIENGLA